MNVEQPNSIINEANIINKIYYEQMKEQLTCTICMDLFNDPLMCSKCETAYCGKCIKSWMSKNESCPMRCPKQSANIIDIHRSTKKFLDGLKLKCKYGCEVSLLAYNAHVIQCENSHKDDTNCWNCGNPSKPSEMKEDKEENILNLIKENEDFVVKSQNFAEEKENGQKEIENFLELLKLKNQKDEVDQKYHNVELKIVAKENIQAMIDSLQKELNNGEDVPYLKNELSKIDKERSEIDKCIDKVTESIEAMQEEKKFMKEYDELKTQLDNLKSKNSINNDFNPMKLAAFNMTTSGNSNFVASPGYENSIKIFNLDNQGLTATLKGHEAPISCLKVGTLASPAQ